MSLRFRFTPTTTTVTAPVVPRATNTFVRNTVLSRALSTPTQLHISAAQVADPRQLLLVLQQMQTALDRATRADRSNPMRGGVFYRKLSVTNNQSFTLVHDLGKPYSGYFITRAYPVGSIWIIAEQTLPTGFTPDVAIQLLPFVSAGPNPGSIDLYVF